MSRVGAADACFIKNVNVRDLAAGSIILRGRGRRGDGTLDGRPFHVGEHLDGE